jgi:DNA polymerase-3 subunit delta
LGEEELIIVLSVKRKNVIKLFYGKDSYRLGQELITETSCDAEVQVFDDGDIAELANLLITQSFFNPRRIFIVKNLFGKLDLKTEKSMYRSLENLPPDTTVIFTEEKQPVKSKIYDLLKKEGEIKAFDDPKSVNLVSFIKKQVEDAGGEIAPLAAERLASYVGPDFWQLKNEIDKLVLYKMGENEVQTIETTDVDLLVRANFEAKIFSLMDAVAAKNTRRAAELLNSFLESGENEIYILTMIEKQFQNIAMAKFESKITETELAKRAGIHPYVAKKSLNQARNFEKVEIINMYNRLMDADLKLKSGFEPKQVLLRVLI